MNVLFVNKYTVTREGHTTYHYLKPEMRRPAPEEETKQTMPMGVKMNNAARVIGLCLALCIIGIAVVGKMFPVLIIGIVLAGMYTLRIFQGRKAAASAQPKPPPSLQQPFVPEDTGKWVRFVRFGDHIEVEDPSGTEEYQYEQITRISDDPAYLTLWMDNGSQVRVAKRGFTIGTLQGFEQFIMGKTHHLIGPATES